MNTKIENNSTNKDQVLQALIEEIRILRQEKEEEAKLRLEAEKRIELALQKCADIQKRMNDWRMAQDAIIKDCRGMMVESTNNLYVRISKLMGKVVNDIKNN